MGASYGTQISIAGGAPILPSYGTPVSIVDPVTGAALTPLVNGTTQLLSGQSYAITGFAGGNGAAGSPGTILDLTQVYTQQAGIFIRPMLHLNASYSAGSADTTSPNPLFVQFVLTGAGANIQGPQVAAAEFWIYPQTTGTLPTRIYALEGTADTVSGTVTTIAVIQGNLRHNGAGTITTGYAVVGMLGPTTNASAVVTNGIAISAQMDLTSMAGSLGTVIGVESQIIQATPAATDTATHNVFGSRLAIPSQGGNTSGGGANYGLKISNSIPAGAGGGTEGVGGQMANYGISIDVPSANGSSPSSGHQNYGLFLTGNGGTVIANLANWAIYSNSTAASSLLGQLRLGSNATIAASTQFAVTSAPAASAAGASTFWRGVYVLPSTLLLTGNSASNLSTGVNLVEIAQPTISGAGTSVISFAATLTILGEPLAAGAGPATITNPYAIWVQSGLTQLVTLAQTGKTTNYNNVATAGWGLPAIYAAGRPAQQVNTTVTLASYVVGAADGSFEVSCNINVTVSTTVTMTVTCTYTDEASVARTLTIPFFILAGTMVQSITTAQGNIAYESPIFHIRARTGTTISVQTAGTVTAVTYTGEATIKQTR